MAAPLPSSRRNFALAGTVACLCLFAGRVYGDAPAGHDYPTVARMEYVESCRDTAGEPLAALYKCSCAIDRIAAKLTYEEFIEASTFAKYATLGGPNAGIFRDGERGKGLAKMYRAVEADALRACGITPAGSPKS
jgi:hypothetical protein